MGFKDDVTLFHGDSMSLLAEMEPESVDAVVTDPPAGIGFLGKSWDNHSTYEPKTQQGRLVLRGVSWLGLKPWEAGFLAFSADWASLTFRVLKPGGHAIVWGLPRTSDLTMLGLRIAGFELRDVIEHLHNKGPRIAQFVDSLSESQLKMLARAVEDDSRCLHLFGSGFPKNYDISKGMDKLLGAVRGKTRIYGSDIRNPSVMNSGIGVEGLNTAPIEAARERGYHETLDNNPVTDEAKEWDGWGTALKPAQEPWILARKPVPNGNVRNMLEHGTGGLNIDGCRVKINSDEGAKTTKVGAHYGDREYTTDTFSGMGGAPWDPSKGRWPTNLVVEHLPECICNGVVKIKGSPSSDRNPKNPETTAKEQWIPQPDPESRRRGYGDADGVEEVISWDCVLRYECGGCKARFWSILTKRCPHCGAEDWKETSPCPAAVLGRQSGESKSISGGKSTSTKEALFCLPPSERGGFDDKGTATRFFPQFQASKPEDDALFTYQSKINPKKRSEGVPSHLKNRHPTVKPQGLMRWLVRLVTPPGGKVLDPFMGSGSTGMAALSEGSTFVGIERDLDSFEIAKWRVRYVYSRNRK